MRKILLVGALALTASSGAAQAVTKISLDGYCNVYSIRNQTGTMAMKDTGCSNAIGGGFLTTIKTQGKTAVFGLHDPGNGDVQFVFQFSYPFVTGGTWSLFSTADGLHLNPVLSGQYTIAVPNGEKAQSGTRSVTGR